MSPSSPGTVERRTLVFRSLLFLAVLTVLIPGTAFAQGQNKSYWGVGASFTPKWVGDPRFTELFVSENDGDIEGTEFSFGLVRGSTRGGDVGVSFVRKPFKDTTLTSLDEECSGSSCYRNSETQSFRNVFVQGVEVHGFINFVTIKNRVQIGINVAGGIGSVKGTIEETSEFESRITLPNGQVIVDTDREVITSPATDVMFKYFPLGKVEVEAAMIVTPAFKIKFAGGMNIPSVSTFRIAAVYLIGAR